MKWFAAFMLAAFVISVLLDLLARNRIEADISKLKARVNALESEKG